MKKKIASLFAAIMLCSLMILGTQRVDAKTLKESFSADSYYTYKRACVGGAMYTKTTWAKTTGYKNEKKHYVRAYQGANMQLDSKRRWAKGDVKASVTAPATFVPTGKLKQQYFLIGYGKYGT